MKLILLIGAAASAMLAACANPEPAPRQTTRMEPRPAPLNSPTAREIPPRETARVEPRPAPRAAAPAATPTPAPTTGPMRSEMNLATLIGSDVKNSQGQTIGEVDNVVLDPSGRVDTVVVTVGGFMGLGGRDVALKWTDLKVNDGGREVIVDMTEMQLKQMPEYQPTRSGTAVTRGAAPNAKD